MLLRGELLQLCCIVVTCCLLDCPRLACLLLEECFIGRRLGDLCRLLVCPRVACLLWEECLLGRRSGDLSCLLECPRVACLLWEEEWGRELLHVLASVALILD